MRAGFVALMLVCVGYARREVESGRPPADVCRQLGVSEATFYIW